MDEFILKVMERDERKEIMREALAQYKANLTRLIIDYEWRLDDISYGFYKGKITLPEGRGLKDIMEDYKKIIDNYYWKRAIVNSLLEEL